MTSNTNWDKFWSHKFVYGSLKGWEVDLFLNIATLLKNIENPTILSAGCGRGKIDYWIISTLGYKSTLLDYSHACIKNLTKSFKKLNKENYVLREGSILDLPFPDDSFDLFGTLVF
jgi:ubiquinone/menaquinone biosynthesis C-methylase UbiE